MGALIDNATDAARTILRCCLASGPASHYPPEEVAARAELVELGEALEAQIADIFHIPWAQFTAPVFSYFIL
jgi:hypothetical protein